MSDSALIPTEESVALTTPSDFNPEKEIENGIRAAKALMAIINAKSKKLMFNGKQYLEFEDWQTLAKFYNLTVMIEWTKRINEGGVDGFGARAVVLNSNGVAISAAEAQCTRAETKWNVKNKYEYVNGKRQVVGTEPVDEFSLRSMAQTRASSKAFRNVLAWVAVLGGYAPTPAEEMPIEEANNAPFESNEFAKPAATTTKPPIRIQDDGKATSAQIGFLKALLDKNQTNWEAQGVTKETLTKSQASNLIKKLQ